MRAGGRPVYAGGTSCVEDDLQADREGSAKPSQIHLSAAAT